MVVLNIYKIAYNGMNNKERQERQERQNYLSQI